MVNIVQSGTGPAKTNPEKFTRGIRLRLRDDVDEPVFIYDAPAGYTQEPFLDAHSIRCLCEGCTVLETWEAQHPFPVLASASAEDCKYALRFNLLPIHLGTWFPAWQFEVVPNDD